MACRDIPTTPQQEHQISVIGLGYVGIAVAVAFSTKFNVIAFDINPNRIEQLKQGHDINCEMTPDDLINERLQFTNNPLDLKLADFHIIAVPSPINQAKHPDFSHLISASRIVGQQIKKGDIVVYESTVYPGATEEKCVPVLEKTSGLKSGSDFFVGYSPERINPGDKERTFSQITKIVSAQTSESLEIVANVYREVIPAGVHPVSSIMVAEAAKVIENTQRDINIALINELSIIFNKLNIDTHEVLEAAGTKWNFLPFKPGLVGGHCIGVDPYYLTHKAIECGLHPEVILSGRRTNDNMGKYVAEQTIKQLSRLGKKIKNAKIGILGLTFKENCTDTRNTRVIDILYELESYHVNVLIHDPLANAPSVKKEYGIDLKPWEALVELDAIILAVSHDQFKSLTPQVLATKLMDPKLVIDVKGLFPQVPFAQENIQIWRL